MFDRDELTWKLTTFIHKYIASDNYGRYIQLMFYYGMKRYAEDEGNSNHFFKFWIPTNERRYKMIAGFLQNDEAATITTDAGDIYFISNNEIKHRNFKTLTPEEKLKFP